MADAGAWVQIRCQSPACDVAGGRILYCQRAGSLVSIKHRGSGGVFLGLTALVLVCRCGWRWRNTDLAGMLKHMEDLEAS